MSEKTRGPDRSAETIARDFAELMASRLPEDVARNKFERLWDETNTLAARAVDTTEAEPYISLLKRMHQTFEGRYAINGSMNGHGRRRP